MKYPCEIIRDLLPLYHDNACSPESAQVVEEHIAECEQCRELCRTLSEVSSPALSAEQERKKANGFLRFKGFLQRKMVKRVIASATITAAAIIMIAIILSNIMLVEPASVIKSFQVKNGLLTCSADPQLREVQFEFIPATENGDGTGTPILLITAKSTLARQLSAFLNTANEAPAVGTFTYPLTEEAWYDAFGADFEQIKADMEEHTYLSEAEIRQMFGPERVLPWGDIEKIYYNCNTNVPSGKLDESQDGLILLWSNEE